MTVWSKDCTVISYTKARQVDLHHSAAVFNICILVNDVTPKS